MVAHQLWELAVGGSNPPSPTRCGVRTWKWCKSAGTAISVRPMIDGNSMYVTETNGTVVKVAINAASQLTKTDPATIKDITPGETVIVRGATATDGSVTATAVTASPAASAAG